MIGNVNPATSAWPQALPAAAPATATATATATDPLAQLIASAESGHQHAFATTLQSLHAAPTGALSSAQLLRLQAAVGAFTIRVQVSVRLAEEAGKALQTLTQRN